MHNLVVDEGPCTGKTVIVSDYINKIGTAQVLDDNAPSRDVRNELASAPIDNLSYRQSNVKEYGSQKDANNLFY